MPHTARSHVPSPVVVDEKHGRTIERLSFPAVLGLAILVGLAAGFLGLEKTWVVGASGVFAGAWTVLTWRSDRPRAEAPGEWQRRIDREYRLEIDGNQVSVFHLEQPCTRFAFEDPIEIQYLSRRDDFPPLFWKVATPAGEFLVPDGGSFGREFKTRFISALPDYRAQRVVHVAPPAEFTRAMSMWRKDDPYPKVDRSDDDLDW